ncbi:hypothetical protein CCACVL1_30278, partial [Corchorus capsularis]
MAAIETGKGKGIVSDDEGDLRPE